MMPLVIVAVGALLPAAKTTTEPVFAPLPGAVRPALPRRETH
jgi:hypothetical protein